MSVQVQVARSAHVPAMAALVAGRVRRLRVAHPDVPATFEASPAVQEVLAPLVTAGQAVVAMAGDEVVGHLAWQELPTFRRAARRAAYVPEYGNAVAHPTDALREALLAGAAQLWDLSGRQVVSVTELHDGIDVGNVDRDSDDGSTVGAHQHWVRNGFGCFLHDAVRACTPIHAPLPAGVHIRPATAGDLVALVALDREHCAHYSRPPVFMVPPEPADAAELARLLAHDPTSVWLAITSTGPQAFIRAEVGAHDTSQLLQGPDSVVVNGVYVRPSLRTAGVGAALLDAVLCDHQRRGTARLILDYETINPPARRFWPRHTTAVTTGYWRVLERC